VPTYAELAGVLASQTETAVLGLWRSVQAGRISRPEFVTAAAGVVHTASAKATGLADVALAARLTQLTGARVAPRGISPGDNTATIMDELQVAATAGDAAAVGVTARTWPHSAGRAAWMTGIQSSDAAGWRRVTSGRCEVCNRMAGAAFLPARISIWEHRACACHPDPVMDDPRSAA
jgi:hypothetical protein